MKKGLIIVSGSVLNKVFGGGYIDSKMYAYDMVNKIAVEI
jgi:hypothetical protein